MIYEEVAVPSLPSVDDLGTSTARSQSAPSLGASSSQVPEGRTPRLLLPKQASHPATRTCHELYSVVNVLCPRRDSNSHGFPTGLKSAAYSVPPRGLCLLRPAGEIRTHKGFLRLILSQEPPSVGLLPVGVDGEIRTPKPKGLSFRGIPVPFTSTLVWREGVEPSRPKALPSRSSAATDYAIPTRFLRSLSRPGKNVLYPCCWGFSGPDFGRG